MSTTIGILAHVDHGKTTLSEQLLFNSGFLQKTGRVDAQTSFLDTNEIERQRGINVFTGSATFKYKDKIFNLLDTPGHVDFGGEMERSAYALDLAILVISAVEGIQGHTNTIWEILKKLKIPTIIFLNKIDRTGANMENVVNSIEEKWGISPVIFDDNFKEGRFSESLREKLCENDEELLEDFLADNYDEEKWSKHTGKLLKNREIFPIFYGSALNNIGVDKLLEGIYYLYPEDKSLENQEFSAKVFKISHDKQKNRVTHLKISTGCAKVKDLISYGDFKEKINEIRRYNGEKYQQISEAFAGDIVGVTGLSGLMPGDSLGNEKSLERTLEPLLRAQVKCDLPVKDTLLLLKELESEDPLLYVEYVGHLKAIYLHIAGQIQLEILPNLFFQRFNHKMELCDCQILYKETVKSPCYGCGHYEPLRHYAEVHLLIEPSEKGSGISFCSQVHVDNLSLNWQNLIESHIFEKKHLGVLTGSPLTDVKITLKNGKNDIKHTSGGDFRESTYRAIRHGLMTGESLLLEPIYSFEIKVEMSLLGKVLSDIDKMFGKAETPLQKGNFVTVKGQAPVAKMDKYATEFVAFTKGQGSLFLKFKDYQPCHNQEEVVQKIAYDADSDTENSADSIFCAKGAGYLVPWREAKSAMHLEIKE